MSLYEGTHLAISDLYFLFRCDLFPNSIGFPTARKNEGNNFVAAVVSNVNKLWKKCPRVCRRKGHLDDWEYC